MKKILAMSCFFLIGSATVSHAYYYENSMPHNRTNDIDCVDCHGEPDWTGQAPMLPSLLKDCTSCHINESGSGFTKTSAPHAQTHHGECWDCHRNHDVRQWFPDVKLVSGTYSVSSYDGPSNTTTFTVDLLSDVDPLWSDPLTWNAKTTIDRGLNLWVSYLPEGDDSFEVTSADATTIIVKGDLTAATDNTFELHYGQMIPDTLNGNDVIFTGPVSFAHNDELAGDIGNDGIIDDLTPDGVCQVCHTTTNHWRLDGTKDTHFGGEKCTNCHTHSGGFIPSAGDYCNGCHGNPPVASTFGGPDGLVNSPYPTGSVSPGAHLKHSDQYGYTFACGICHTNGMPVTPLSGNDQIQIGFQIWNFDGTGTKYDGRNDLVAPFTYEGTNGTQVTTGNAQTCSNIYCHSDGTSLATSFFTPTKYTGPNNTTPAWTGNWVEVIPPYPTPDVGTCDNCHQYPPLYNMDEPKANSHDIHAFKNYGECSLCHYGITQDGVTIADASKHHNGVYNVSPGPTFFLNETYPNKSLSFTYQYDAGGGTCSSNSCHLAVNAPPTVKWGRTYLVAGATTVKGDICGEVTVNVNVSGFYTTSYSNVVQTPPYQCYYEWGDGTFQDWSEDCSGTHIYSDGNRKTISWSVRDAKLHTTNDSFNGVEILYTYPSFSSCTDPATVDSDGDGMYDVWEISHELNPDDSADAAFDLDGDSLTNFQEFTLGSDPGVIDTDNDGVDDAHDGDPADPGVTTCSNAIQIDGTSNYYNTVTDLIGGGLLMDNGTILVSASGLTGDVLFNQSVTVNFAGGYDCGFTYSVTDTVITGTLTITDGTLIVDKITIK